MDKKVIVTTDEKTYLIYFSVVRLFLLLQSVRVLSTMSRKSYENMQISSIAEIVATLAERSRVMWDPITYSKKLIENKEKDCQSLYNASSKLVISILFILLVVYSSDEFYVKLVWP